MATFNPTPAEAATLAAIKKRESGGSYTATVSPANCAAMGYTVCTASGAYMFIDSTWQSVAQQTGVGTEYASASDAPQWMQDINALWLLRQYGPDASQSWGASAPASSAAIAGSSTQPIIDVIGSDATTSTSDLLSSLESSVTGIDLTNPMTDLALLAAAGAALFLITTR